MVADAAAEEKECAGVSSVDEMCMNSLLNRAFNIEVFSSAFNFVIGDVIVDRRDPPRCPALRNIANLIYELLK